MLLCALLGVHASLGVHAVDLMSWESGLWACLRPYCFLTTYTVRCGELFRLRARHDQSLYCASPAGMLACAQSIVLLAKADTSICLIMVGPIAEVCTCIYQQQCEQFFSTMPI